MAKETFDAIFRLTLNLDGTFDVEDKGGWAKFCAEFNDIQMLAEFKQEALLSEKRRLYNYIHGPVMDMAIKYYAYIGYDGIDKVKCKYMLKAEFAKGFVFNRSTNKHEPYVIDFTDMSKNRLLKFLNDVLIMLETNGFEVPDSQQYKEMMQEKIKKVRNIPK